jgi:hypothetical protein
MRKLKKHIIGLTTPRTGSSYVFDSLSYYHKKYNCPGNTDFGELYHPKKIEAHAKSFTLNQSNVIITNIPSGIISEYYFLKLQRGDYNITDHNKKIEYSKYLLDLQMKAKSAYVCKVHSYHLDWIDNNQFINLLRLPTTSSFFVYRRDIEDNLLSLLIATHSDMWNSRHLALERSPDINSSRDISKKEIDNCYSDTIIDYNHAEYVSILSNAIHQIFQTYYSWYPKICWDYTIAYEDLKGDPTVDFQKYFENNLEPIEDDTKINRKLLSKEEKITKLNNYDMFRSILDLELKKYNMPLFLDRL